MENESHSLRSELELVEEIEGKIEEARKRAEELGEIVGEISRYEEVTMGSPPKIVASFYPNAYFKHKKLLAAVGNYVGIIDVGTLELVSARVSSIARIDTMAAISSDAKSMPSVPIPAPHGLVGKPAANIEPLLALEVKTEGDNVQLGEGRAARYAIEPQSPIILPKPEILERMLALPSAGPIFGALTVGEEAIEYGNKVAKVRLPIEDLLFHILILGTTGSGKTTFIKNLIQDLRNYEVNSLKPVIFIVDCNGDYTQIIFPSECEDELAKKLYGENIHLPNYIKVILPTTHEFVKNISSLETLAERYYEQAFSWIIKRLEHEGYKVESEFSKVDEPTPTGIIHLRILKREDSGERLIHEVEISIIPYAFKFLEVKKEIKNLSPYFTEQARELLDRLFKYIEEKAERQLKTLEEYIKEIAGMSARDIEQETNIHRGTVMNIIRNLIILNDSGLFDVKINETEIKEPKLKDIVEQGDIVLLDIYNADIQPKAGKILALRLLDQVFAWKKTLEAVGEPNPLAFVVIDEAHRFFPTHGLEEESYVVLVASKLERIARMGRARGLGLILATHSPKDIHQVVLNLCNTKVVFRLESTLVKELGLPRDYAELISKASDRIMVIKSHALRLHYITAKTPLSVVGHFKRY